MSQEIYIRPETGDDETAIADITTKAFASTPYSNQKEALIIQDLRNAGALSLSLVAEISGEIVGHVSFSKVMIDGQNLGYYGLAPVSVLPAHQGQKIGSQLIEYGLNALKDLHAKGCVLLGEPDYYQRFGFKAEDQLILEGVPPEYFMALAFAPPLPSGIVTYHQAFADNA